MAFSYKLLQTASGLAAKGYSFCGCGLASFDGGGSYPVGWWIADDAHAVFLDEDGRLLDRSPVKKMNDEDEWE